MFGGSFSRLFVAAGRSRTSADSSDVLAVPIAVHATIFFATEALDVGEDSGGFAVAELASAAGNALALPSAQPHPPEMDAWRRSEVAWKVSRKVQERVLRSFLPAWRLVAVAGAQEMRREMRHARAVHRRFLVRAWRSCVVRAAATRAKAEKMAACLREMQTQRYVREQLLCVRASALQRSICMQRVARAVHACFAVWRREAVLSVFAETAARRQERDLLSIAFHALRRWEEMRAPRKHFHRRLCAKVQRLVLDSWRSAVDAVLLRECKVETVAESRISRSKRHALQLLHGYARRRRSLLEAAASGPLRRPQRLAAGFGALKENVEQRFAGRSRTLVATAGPRWQQRRALAALQQNALRRARGSALVVPGFHKRLAQRRCLRLLREHAIRRIAWRRMNVTDVSSVRWKRSALRALRQHALERAGARSLAAPSVAFHRQFLQRRALQLFWEFAERCVFWRRTDHEALLWARRREKIRCLRQLLLLRCRKRSVAGVAASIACRRARGGMTMLRWHAKLCRGGHCAARLSVSSTLQAFLSRWSLEAQAHAWRGGLPPAALKLCRWIFGLCLREVPLPDIIAWWHNAAWETKQLRRAAGQREVCLKKRTLRSLSAWLQDATAARESCQRLALKRLARFQRCLLQGWRLCLAQLRHAHLQCERRAAVLARFQVRLWRLATAFSAEERLLRQAAWEAWLYHRDFCQEARDSLRRERWCEGVCQALCTRRLLGQLADCFASWSQRAKAVSAYWQRGREACCLAAARRKKAREHHAERANIRCFAAA
eukprot:TRINITY_DN64720_c0_g1_i1.p1 TRINITY_DN64720_c0_g1~~TRINITY_DN64720_c0_g1_i1.p1  ORF type:complete len:779 (-),score=155.93 TRINITY_DN64720_c0_g1_i1:632-2968(-)